jgi:hypothetical protein
MYSRLMFNFMYGRMTIWNSLNMIWKSSWEKCVCVCVCVSEWVSEWESEWERESLVSTIEELLERKSNSCGLEPRYSCRGSAVLTTWHPSISKIGTNFDKWRSLGRYSSLADSGHGVLFCVCVWICVHGHDMFWMVYSCMWTQTNTHTHTHTHREALTPSNAISAVTVTKQANFVSVEILGKPNWLLFWMITFI